MEKVLTLNDIKKVATDILKVAQKKIKKNASVVAFYGDLGVGKTTITKELAKDLGVEDNVVSPTFVIMKIYKTKNKIFKNLIHIDAYRLKNGQELNHLGFKEILKNKENLVIIEWPNNVEDCLPTDTIKIILEHKNETTRSIKFCYN
jgi:tRNA threonylcarbamoyladenosine biosynthesis protein TsaE